MISTIICIKMIFDLQPNSPEWVHRRWRWWTSHRLSCRLTTGAHEPQCCPLPWSKRTIELQWQSNRHLQFHSSSYAQLNITLIIKELTTYYQKDSFRFSRWCLSKCSTKTSLVQLSAAHMREHTHSQAQELGKSLMQSSFHNEKNTSLEIKAMKWHCSHQEWEEEKEGGWGWAPWV